MNLSLQQQRAICQSAKCVSIKAQTRIQSLWAGQGELSRLVLITASGEEKTLVAKQIALHASAEHPRGWNTDLSQRRKRKSYEIELHWYRKFATVRGQINPLAPIPALVYSEESETGILLVMENLAHDFPIRFTAGKDDRPSNRQILSCIRWLAQFHAQHLHHDTDGLWPVGGYWHLDTRPDEWQALPEGELKHAAQTLDNQLRSCPYQTVVHGDAKLANFCFSPSGELVAAVDFQYVGGGPGVKDLMLLLSSVMPDERLLTEAEGLVEFYFDLLVDALTQTHPQVNANELIGLWRPLYAVAWADFHRFLSGWSPGHWKIGQYCRQQTQLALNR